MGNFTHPSEVGGNVDTDNERSDTGRFRTVQGHQRGCLLLARGPQFDDRAALLDRFGCQGLIVLHQGPRGFLQRRRDQRADIRQPVGQSLYFVPQRHTHGRS